MSKAFLCHSSRDVRFTLGLAAYLQRILDKVFFFEEHQKAYQPFVTTINLAISECDVFVTVIGEEVSRWQIEEATSALELDSNNRSFFTIRLRDGRGEPCAIPDELLHLRKRYVLTPEGSDAESIRSIASQIVTKLGHPWRADDLPVHPHLFSYEKDIIAFFLRNSVLEESAPSSEEAARDRKMILDKILNGCPREWPEVEKWSDESLPNKLPPEEVGLWRKAEAHVLTTALMNETTLAVASGEKENQPSLKNLSFPEAGPREHLYFPRRGRQLTVAILVSGGIAPGINAVIDGIVQRHWLYAERHGYAENGLTILGLRNGFRAFDNLTTNHFLLATNHRQYPGAGGRRLETPNHVYEGGSILGTSRVDELIDFESREAELARIIGILAAYNVDILYIIGGDGSMKAAHAIWSMAQTTPRAPSPLSVVAIPKTMDNDILWVWQSFGFLSAVEKAREIIQQLNTEVASNPRLCIAQLFGSDSGFVVSHAVLASGTGHCDLALIPEIEFTMDKIAEYLTRKIMNRGLHLPHGLVVMSETAIPRDAMRYVGAPGEKPEIDIQLSDKEKAAIREFESMRDKKMRIQGQTNDFLRTAGLKIVSRGLERLLPIQAVADDHPGSTDWTKLRVFTNEPRHLLRAIPPSCSDIIIGNRLGTLAVDNAVAGYTDFMISQWLTEYVLVPLKLVVLGRKRITQEGIFWKSVLTKTGQPAGLA